MAARFANEKVAEWTIGVLTGPIVPPWEPCTARVRTPRAGRGLGSRVMAFAPVGNLVCRELCREAIVG